MQTSGGLLASHRKSGQFHLTSTLHVWSSFVSALGQRRVCSRVGMSVQYVLCTVYTSQYEVVPPAAALLHLYFSLFPTVVACIVPPA
jgi:hypothetical protein